MKNICVIGSSFLWVPTLVDDLLSKFYDEALEIRFLDIVAEHAEICKQWGEVASKAYGRNDKYYAYTDRRKALDGADAVMITISTGGLEAMSHDIAIPENMEYLQLSEILLELVDGQGQFEIFQYLWISLKIFARCAQMLLLLTIQIQCLP